MSRLFVSLWLLACVLALAPSSVAAQTNQGNYTGSYVAYPIPYAAACQSAAGMAVDSSGSMYIACGSFSSIIVMDAMGNFQRNISLPDSQVYSPFGIAFSGSSMYVTSLWDNTVFEFTTATGVLVAQWSTTNLNEPWGIAVDGSGNVWVANYGQGNVLQFTSNGTLLATFATSNPAMNNPEEIAIDGLGNVFVVDTDNNRVVKFNSGGSVVAIYNSTTPALNEPGGIALDSQGSIYICDTWNYAVIKLDSNGNQIETLSSPLGNGTVQISAAAGLTIDSFNQVYVLDSVSNNRVLKFPATLLASSSSSSTASTVAVTSSSSSSAAAEPIINSAASATSAVSALMVAAAVSMMALLL